MSGVSNPIAYGLAIVLFGGWLGLFYVVRLVLAGKLRTEAEYLATMKRAETAESALRVRDEQMNAAIGVLPKIAAVLEKFHVAGEQVRQERADS